MEAIGLERLTRQAGTMLTNDRTRQPKHFNQLQTTFLPLSGSFPFHVFQKPSFIPYRSDLFSRVVVKSLASPRFQVCTHLSSSMKNFRIVPMSIRLSWPKAEK